eukprot:TRINITY_DN9648_c0_g1_i2.p1 TRINITY_DN9648_c0_g1~~TRINITY_DN9648_c0_g1_i2.p1  ORF type:complete len:143 (+),score=23.53 TRINITY_DN9648_c0_g1_i2:249-677(+)
MSCCTNLASRSVNMYRPPLRSSVKGTLVPVFSSVLAMRDEQRKVGNTVISRGNVVRSAVQETSTSTASETKEAATAGNDAPPSPPKRVPPAKAPAKPLPQLMEEDVIPPLKAILEAQEDLSQIELSFSDNRVSVVQELCTKY